MLRLYEVIHIPIESDMSASTLDLLKSGRTLICKCLIVTSDLQGVTERTVSDGASKQLVCFKTTSRKCK
jgi:hypothetical protein